VLREANILHDRWPSLVANDKRKVAEAMVEKRVSGKAEININ